MDRDDNKGENINEGRVEVCISNAGGTVCNDGMSQETAQVACKQLGFDRGKNSRVKHFCVLVHLKAWA